MSKQTPFSAVSQIINVVGRHRPWHAELQDKFKLHPAVEAILQDGHWPTNWALLALEFPHVSESDAHMLAYTQSEAKGLKNIQTKLKPGKYIKRHFPALKDDYIRDLVEANIYTFGTVDTIEEIVALTQAGPRSCMQMRNNDFENHPYRVYAPELGWKLAYLKRGDKVWGRALVNGNVFVRTYGGDPDSYSYASNCPALEDWLESQGHYHEDEWAKGTKVARVQNSWGNTLMPYIDGGRQEADETAYGFVLVRDGEYECSSQSGILEEKTPDWHCNDCGDGHDEDDDRYYIGRYSDNVVCENCIDSYTCVTGAGRYEDSYYVPNDDAVECSGDYYDENNLPEYIVELENGNYANTKEDDVIQLHGEYYLCDDDRVVEVDGDWELKENCVLDWQNEWQAAECCVEIRDGEQCHVDHCHQCQFDGDFYPEVEMTQVGEHWVADDNVEEYEALHALAA